MIIDLSLVVIFLMSTFVLWYRVSLRIPELVAIPDDVIAERLHEDSARLRLFLMHLKTYYREGRHKLYLWKFLAKTLYRFHLFLLKIDNATASLLKKVKLNGKFINGNGEGEARDTQYWHKIQEKAPTLVAPSLRNNRITEVRRKG